MTLGIFVGILLFSCVAFQLSYYNFCPQSEQLYVTYMDGPFTYGPFSAAMRENFPKEVEDATILMDMGTNVFYNGNVRLTESTIYADEHLFSTLGLKLLIGKAEELTRPDVLFIPVRWRKNKRREQFGKCYRQDFIPLTAKSR